MTMSSMPTSGSVLKKVLEQLTFDAGILLQQYQGLVQSQALKPDAQQQACIQQLSQLCDQLSTYSSEVDRFQQASLKYLVRLFSYFLSFQSGTGCTLSCVFSIWRYFSAWHLDDKQYLITCAAMSHPSDQVSFTYLLVTIEHQLQAEAAELRAELKRKEAEAITLKKQQEAQRSAIWQQVLRRIQPQQQDEATPQEVALMTARAREEKVQEVLGRPPEPPTAPKGRHVVNTSQT